MGAAVPNITVTRLRTRVVLFAGTLAGVCLALVVASWLNFEDSGGMLAVEIGATALALAEIDFRLRRARGTRGFPVEPVATKTISCSGRALSDLDVPGQPDQQSLEPVGIDGSDSAENLALFSGVEVTQSDA